MIPFHFQTRFYAALERLGWVRRRIVSATLLNKTYQVLAGSLRTQDYDDAWLLALGCHATMVMDVGCNVGQSALLLLHSDSVQEILLLDPNPSALALCAENLIRNGLSPRARFIPAFASDICDAQIDFFTVGAGAAGSKYGGQAQTACALGRTLRVRTVTLDALCDRYALVPDLVKVDVEGAENEVLRGARQLAAQQQTRFIVELHSHPQRSMATNAGEVLQWCGESGYAAWYLKTQQRIKDASMLKARGRCHVLLLPGTEPFPEYLQTLPQGAPLSAVFVPQPSRLRVLAASRCEFPPWGWIRAARSRPNRVPLRRM